MSFYATDEDIAELYDGETVPGANTIVEARNTRIKIRVNNKINGIVLATSQITDTFGDLKELFIKLYKQVIDGEPIVIDEDDENMIVSLYGGTGDGGVPVIIHDFNEWDINESG